MKRILKVFLFIILFIPVYAKAATYDVNSAIMFKALLSTGADIKITGDFTIDGNYQVNAASTIDLNGHTINLEGNTLLPYESLTIKDTSSDQSGKMIGSGTFLFQVGNSTVPGSLTIEGGTFETNGSYGIVNNLGTFTLNGGTLKGKSFVVYNRKNFEMNGGSIISSTGTSVYVNNDATFTMNGGNITLTGDYYAIGLAKPGAKVIINDGTIEAMYSNPEGTSGGNAIGAFKDTEVTINGGTLKSYGVTMLGNGSDSGPNEGTNAKFNINGGTLNSTISAAIYAPQVNGLTTITGGTLTGKTGVEIRAGKLIITGGTINADTENYVVTDNTNGVTTKGAAISVVQHTTKQPIEVIITGGNFSGNVPVSGTNPLNHSSDITDKVTYDISGGIFTSSSDTTVTVIGDNRFITGGDFSNNVTNYVVDGYGEKDLTSNSIRVLPYRKINIDSGTDYEVVGKDNAFPGDEIEIKPKYKKGYEVEEIIVIDYDGNRITVTNNKFLMPNKDITISIKYKKINNPPTGDNILIYIVGLVISILLLLILKKKRKY